VNSVHFSLISIFLFSYWVGDRMFCTFYKTWMQLKERVWNRHRRHSFVEAFDKGRNLLKETVLMALQITV